MDPSITRLAPACQGTAITPQLVPECPWTGQFVKKALREAEKHDYSYIFHLLQTSIPESFIQAKPRIIYQVISKGIENENGLTPRMKKICIQTLRTLQLPESMKDSTLIAEDQSKYRVNSLLGHLVLPCAFRQKNQSFLPMDGPSVSALREYIECATLPQTLPIRSGFRLMKWAHFAKQDELLEATFSKVVELLSKRYDTLEDWCSLLGLCYLDTGDVPALRNLPHFQECFDEEISRLLTSTAFVTKESMQKLHYLSQMQWNRLLFAIGIESDATEYLTPPDTPQSCCEGEVPREEAKSFTGVARLLYDSMGPVRPTALIRLLSTHSLANSFFHALHHIYNRGIILRICDHDDLDAWGQIQALPRDDWGNICFNEMAKREGLSLQIKGVEMSLKYAESIWGKDTSSQYAKYQKPLSKWVADPSAQIVIGLRADQSGGKAYPFR